MFISDVRMTQIPVRVCHSTCYKWYFSNVCRIQKTRHYSSHHSASAMPILLLISAMCFGSSLTTIHLRRYIRLKYEGTSKGFHTSFFKKFLLKKQENYFSI
jgi:hypothetical protein